jgi:type VI secretion system secreted protein VgrG
MSATQDKRILTVTTPLGKDVLLINNFTGTERISRLFSFNLQLLAERDRASSVSAEKLIGQKVSVSLELRGGKRRFFHGIVSQFTEGERDERFQYYQAEVVPWFWLLTLTSDCRIFQDLTVPEIIRKVFKDLGFTDFREALTRNYTKWDYCVQYRETDFNFVSRLMEQEGIFYFFEHKEDKHTLVLADSPRAHAPCPGQPEARYYADAGMGEREDTVGSWKVEQTLRPGKYAMRDYHFEMPGKTLEVAEPSIHGTNGHRNLEVFDYPGEYAQQFNKPGQRLGDVEPEARKLVKLRMEEEETPHQIITGFSYCRSFAAGFRFDLTGHWNAKNPYVLISVDHSVSQSPTYFTGELVDAPYHNSFTCLPQSIPFRPSRQSLRPLVQGPQTAVVVGPSGEEIFTDKYGRVKVQFHWDREGKRDENSSCWIRVAQGWAGKQWGAMYIPRIGQEVIVDFLEGDPDQPIITGSVYNAEQMPFYNLPEFKTLSYVKSDSSKGGKGFNELRFEDKKGSEQVFIHSQRRMDVRALGSLYETNHADRHVVIGLPKGTEQGGNFNLTVGGDNNIHVKGGRYENVEGKLNLSAGGSVVYDVGGDHATIVGGKAELNATEVTIEALTKLTLKVGPNFIMIEPSGVTIHGPIIKNFGAVVQGPFIKELATTLNLKTGDPMIEDPMDAETSDTGEPGYLDRAARAGGARKKRVVMSKHLGT